MKVELKSGLFVSFLWATGTFCRRSIIYTSAAHFLSEWYTSVDWTGEGQRPVYTHTASNVGLIVICVLRVVNSLTPYLNHSRLIFMFSRALLYRTLLSRTVTMLHDCRRSQRTNIKANTGRQLAGIGDKHVIPGNVSPST